MALVTKKMGKNCAEVRLGVERWPDWKMEAMGFDPSVRKQYNSVERIGNTTIELKITVHSDEAMQRLEDLE